MREILRPLGKNRDIFVKDVKELYKIMREQQYESQGKRIPAGDLLSLSEEKAFGRCLHQIATCLTDPFRKNIHIFEINSSKSLKETIYQAFVQGKFIRFFLCISSICLLAREKLSQTKKMFDKTVHEEEHLALRWSIGNMNEKQSAATTKIWNDSTKVY